MADGFRDYDRWKLASPEDEADERERQRLKAEDDMERADVIRDREKDEKANTSSHRRNCPLIRSVPVDG